MKSSQPFSFYLENNKPYFVTTNQNELCTDYGVNREVNDQIDCRQAFPVANSVLGGVTYENILNSNILANGGIEDPTLPAGCHVIADNLLGNLLEYNTAMPGSSHVNAWQVCKSCKYQIIKRVGNLTRICNSQKLPISIDVIILMFQWQYLVKSIRTAHMLDILVTIHAKMAARQRLHANVS